MKRLFFLFMILPALAIVLAPPLQAQVYDVDWWAVGGGGAILVGGAYTLTGNAGQPGAGELKGGNYSLSGGFLAVETQGFLFLPLIIKD